MPELTPLGFQKPSGAELVRNGDNVISANAQKADDILQTQKAQLDDLDQRTTAQFAAWDLRTTAHIDGGAPATLYTPEQLIDGGTV
ncbi:hypothetical protein [Paenarthrobacter sp. CAP02]|uniref:hypothetical protein n=1 Tax=Paenarthrobacter sp. CAP02 TaxID=3158144 RepID=UPI0032DA1704